MVERGHEMGRGDEWQVGGRRASGRMGASSAGWMEEALQFSWRPRPSMDALTLARSGLCSMQQQQSGVRSAGQRGGGSG